MSKIFFGALGIMAVYMAVLVGPDFRRYMRIRAM